MSRKNVSDVVAGAGLLNTIVTLLSNEVSAWHGTEEDWHRLSRPDGQKTIVNMAKLIAGVFTVTVDYDSPNYRSLRMQGGFVEEHFPVKNSGQKTLHFKVLSFDANYTIMSAVEDIQRSGWMRCPDLAETAAFHDKCPAEGHDAPILSICGTLEEDADDNVHIHSSAGQCGTLPLLRTINKNVRVLVVMNIE